VVFKSKILGSILLAQQRSSWYLYICCFSFYSFASENPCLGWRGSFHAFMAFLLVLFTQQVNIGAVIWQLMYSVCLLTPVAILEWKNWGGTAGPRKKVGQHKCLSCMVIFRCFQDKVATINPIKHNIGLWMSLWASVIFHQRHLNATVDAITHVSYFVEYSVLTMQLPQHYTCKTKHHFPYTIVPTPHERKQLYESEYNARESEIVLTTNSNLTQRQVGCW